MLLEFAGEAGFGDSSDGETTEDNTNQDTNERKSTNARVPTALFLEGNRIGFEEEIEDAVDQSHVNCDKKQDRLLEEHDKRPESVGIYQRM